MRAAVALSGGGFRAALFHLGVLRRIAELGWLPMVDAISGVSGGSIIAAFAALRWNQMLSAGGDVAAFERHIAGPFVTAITTQKYSRRVAVRTMSTGPIRIFDRTFTRTSALGDILSESLYGNGQCTELPDSPYTVLNATSLVSVRAWRFTRHGLGDSRSDMQSGIAATSCRSAKRLPPAPHFHRYSLQHESMRVSTSSAARCIVTTRSTFRTPSPSRMAVCTKISEPRL